MPSGRTSCQLGPCLEDRERSVWFQLMWGGRGGGGRAIVWAADC